MTLPDFLGIGAMRSGTSWLDSVLRTHPDIYMPNRVKEIHFFDSNYDRGISWYKGFFPCPGHGYTAVGEITPRYLFHGSRVSEHIAHTLGVQTKLLVILRNPVDRAYSHYKSMLEQGRIPKDATFNDVLNSHPDVFKRGLYAEQIQKYMEYFPREQFLFFVFELAVEDINNTAGALSDFLAIDKEGFVIGEKQQCRVGASSKPSGYNLYAAAKRTSRTCRKHGFHSVINVAKKTGLKKFLKSNSTFPPLDTATRKRLFDRYAYDIERTERLTNLKLNLWTP